MKNIAFQLIHFYLLACDAKSLTSSWRYFRSRKVFIVGAMLVGMAMLLPAKPVIAHPEHGIFILRLAGQSLAPNMMLAGLGIAFLFGTGHALAPGHGKTMVAAYLVSSRLTPFHALLLGLVVTFTHTLGVFALGFLALFASPYILPEQLYPILSFISGIAVCGVGFWLLDSRLLHKSDGDRNNRAHHHHHTDGDRVHHHLPDSPVTLRSLIALGIAGGIVPCPEALVLLMSAIALHQAAYGMLLLVAFSLGLASVLIAIGLTVLYAGQWLARFPSSGVLQQHLPVASAIAVILAGIVLTAGAIS